jgi:hypothetical protein
MRSRGLHVTPGLEVTAGGPPLALTEVGVPTGAKKHVPPGAAGWCLQTHQSSSINPGSTRCRVHATPLGAPLFSHSLGWGAHMAVITLF